MTEFLKFTDISNKIKKTKKFEVYSAHDGSYLGYVHWRTGWRRYVMHFESECDWSIECMNQCYKFIATLMQERNKPEEHSDAVRRPSMFNISREA